MCTYSYLHACTDTDIRRYIHRHKHGGSHAVSVSYTHTHTPVFIYSTADPPTHTHLSSYTVHIPHTCTHTHLSSYTVQQTTPLPPPTHAHTHLFSYTVQQTTFSNWLIPFILFWVVHTIIPPLPGSQNIIWRLSLCVMNHREEELLGNGIQQKRCSVPDSNHFSR